MCHNFGADEDVDLFTPDYRINSTYYQWGNPTAIVGNSTSSVGISPAYYMEFYSSFHN
jgi:hypothetical protein